MNPLSQVCLRPKKGVIWAQRRKNRFSGKNGPKMLFFEESRGVFGSQEADFCSKCLVLSHYKLLGWWHSQIVISPIYRYTLPINLRQFFWMVFWGKIYTRSELQILTQVLIGLRDDSKKVWTVSEDNCFCRAFYPSGRLHWDKRDYFITYKNPTPISSANHLALLIYL